MHAGQYVKVKSPVPYALMKEMPHHVKYGINFAFGGTGVFDTSVEGPNMTTQIDTLEGLLNDKVYTKSELANSVALVSVAGNDYDYYLATNGSVEASIFSPLHLFELEGPCDSYLRYHRPNVAILGGLGILCKK